MSSDPSLVAWTKSLTRESRFDSRLQIRGGSLRRGDLTEVEWRILRVLLRLNGSLESEAAGADETPVYRLGPTPQVFSTALRSQRLPHLALTSMRSQRRIPQLAPSRGQKS
jgi:hypothetical protein